MIMMLSKHSKAPVVLIFLSLFQTCWLIPPGILVVYPDAFNEK